MPPAITRESLVAAVKETLLANAVASGIAKIFLFNPHPDYACVPSNTGMDLAIFCAPFSSLPVTDNHESHCVDACFSSFRKIHPESAPVHAKAAGNYVNSYLALSEAKARNCGEAILLDTMGFVAEGGTSNIFMVKEGRVMTPTLRSILPGITRMFILDIVGKFLDCRETDITPVEMKGADEAFFSNSVERVMPVRSVDGSVLRAPCPGPLTRSIIDRIGEVIEGKNSAYERWLTPV
jgi:branched-chain amino acid aminotransferase